MNQEAIERILSGIMEELADVEHQRWSSWQSHVHEQCHEEADGSLRISAEAVERWERQIRTDYEDLSESEKESDRRQVRKYLPLVVKALAK